MANDAVQQDSRENISCMLQILETTTSGALTTLADEQK